MNELENIQQPSKKRPLKILLYPDPKLKRICQPANKEKLEEVNQFINLMFDTMNFYNGIGLAAPQVGVGMRVIVGDVDGKQFAMINPEIVDSEGEITLLEGCLSFPYGTGEVSRNERIVVRFLDREWNEQEQAFEGLIAACIQHEIDHLNGILFIDRVSRMRKQILLKKSKKHNKRIQKSFR